MQLPFTIRKERKPKPKSDPAWKKRYQQAHEAWFKVQYPNAYKDGHYTGPKFPDVNSTNGLTTAVVQYITWNGHYANRINTQGQAVGEEVQFAGGKVKKLSWRKGATRPGTADIASKFNLPAKSPYAIPVDIEIKWNKDTVKEAQVKEKARIESVKGVYVVVKSIEMFYEWFDEFVK